MYPIIHPSNSSTLATSCEELTHWKRPWCWEGLGSGGEGDDQGWDGWMASRTRCTWIWVNSGSWWWTGRPGVLRFMGSQSQTRLSNWTELNWIQNEKAKHWIKDQHQTKYISTLQPWLLKSGTASSVPFKACGLQKVAFINSWMSLKVIFLRLNSQH